VGASTVTIDPIALARTLLAQGFDFGNGQPLKFKAALPQNLAPWADLALDAGRKWSVNPWFIIGVIERESLGGQALKPVGPEGSGDFLPRKTTSPYWKYASPKTGLPPDDVGWGRGLMQIDYGVYNDWVTNHDWRDPAVNIDFGTQLLRRGLDFFKQQAGVSVVIEPWRWSIGMPQYSIQPWSKRYPGITVKTVAKDPRPLAGAPLYEAAIAAFNAGTRGVLQAIAAGLPAEAPCTGQDYVAWFLQRIGTWAASVSEGANLVPPQS
jgi:hypothetical protein